MIVAAAFFILYQSIDDL